MKKKKVGLIKFEDLDWTFDPHTTVCYLNESEIESFKETAKVLKSIYLDICDHEKLEKNIDKNLSKLGQKND